MSAIITEDGSVLHVDQPATITSQVWPRMWVGGSFAPYPPELVVDVAVLACPRYEVCSPGPTATTAMDVPLRDGRISRAELAEAQAVADYLAGRWLEGATVAFRCYLGLNRSSLLAALTRITATGADPGSVIADIRAARGPDALCNPAFAAYLEGPS